MKKTSSLRQSKSRRDRPDLYQQVTDKIIAAIKSDTLPWRKPWQTDKAKVYSGSVMQQNASTGYHYSGVNVLLLWMAAVQRGYHSQRWLTYKQATAVGGHVRAGETATLAVVFKPWDKPVEDADGKPQCDEQGNPVTTRIAMLKPLYLFNIAQCDNLPDAVDGTILADVSKEEITQADTKIQEQVGAMWEQQRSMSCVNSVWVQQRLVGL